MASTVGKGCEHGERQPLQHMQGHGKPGVEQNHPEKPLAPAVLGSIVTVVNKDLTRTIQGGKVYLGAR